MTGGGEGRRGGSRLRLGKQWLRGWYVFFMVLGCCIFALGPVSGLFALASGPLSWVGAAWGVLGLLYLGVVTPLLFHGLARVLSRDVQGWDTPQTSAEQVNGL
jgi:hypothetical protein